MIELLSHHHAFVEETLKFIYLLWNTFDIYSVYESVFLQCYCINLLATFSASALSKTCYKQRKKITILKTIQCWVHLNKCHDGSQNVPCVWKNTQVAPSIVKI